MAHVSSLHSISKFSHLSETNVSFKIGLEKCRKQRGISCETDHRDDHPTHGLKIHVADWVEKRRRVLLQTVFSVVSFPLLVSNALADYDVADDFRVFSDDVNKFKISIPKEWQVSAGEPNGFKSITAFHPEEATTSNVSVVITGLGADFTRMESFGKVEAFAENLVSGLDRSWQKPAGVIAKLIDSKSSKGFYYIEYSLQKPGESRRHIYTALGMASNGWYNRLYTVTGQFMEEESDKYNAKIEKAIASFRFT